MFEKFNYRLRTSTYLETISLHSEENGATTGKRSNCTDHTQEPAVNNGVRLSELPPLSFCLRLQSTLSVVSEDIRSRFLESRSKYASFARGSHPTSHER